MRINLQTVRMAAITLVLPLLSLASEHRQHNVERGQAGGFDFYLFVLSWSPEYCYSHRSAPECAAHKGFVVHGLWPQNADGTYPLNCSTNQPPASNPNVVADIMPPEIIPHEWRQHGTCSGLSGDAYLALMRRLHDSIRIPEQFQAPRSSFASSPRQLKQEFEEANPGLDPADLAIQLHGRYLNAIEVCMSKSAQPRPIACSGVRDATGGTFLVPPVR